MEIYVSLYRVPPLIQKKCQYQSGFYAEYSTEKQKKYKNKSGSKPLPPKTQNLIAAIENYNLYQQLCLRALLILNTLWYHSLNVLREDFTVSLRIN